MKPFRAVLLGIVALGLGSLAQAAGTFTEGTQYQVLTQPQHTTVPKGKVEVLEVFSYACPACNLFQPVMHALEKSLPPNAQMAFLPAAFHPEEDWTVFQRAYFTAQALNIAARTHQQIFDAVWESGELATIDPGTRRLKDPLPSIEDVAKTYERLTGTKADAFLTAAKSMNIDTKMKAADAQIVAMRVPGTPSIVVNGKYMVNMEAMHSQDDIIDVVCLLIHQEAYPAKAP